MPTMRQWLRHVCQLSGVLVTTLLVSACLSDTEGNSPFGGIEPIAPDMGADIAPDATAEVEVLCQPGTRRCLEGTSSPLSEVCAPDGTRWIVDPCDAGQICREARCVSFSCSPGRPVCAGRDASATCAQGGRSVTEITPCAGDEICSGGTCVDLCAEAARSQSYIGCRYTAQRLYNFYESRTDSPTSTTSQSPYAIIAANPQRFIDVEVDVRGPDGAPVPLLNNLRLVPDEQYSLGRETTVSSIILKSGQEQRQLGDTARGVRIPPQSAAVLLIDPFSGRGPYTIESTRPIVAYQFSPYCCNFTATNDASILLPTTTLGTRYRVVNYPMMTFDSGDGDSSLAVSPYIAIATTDEAATVEVTSPVALLVEEQDYQLISTRAVTDADTEHTLSLPPHSRVVLRLPRSFSSDAEDISGAVIDSDTPVAAFVGHPCTHVPQDAAACDHLQEQLLPAATLGQRYALPAPQPRNRGADNREGTYWQLVADEDLTITTSPPIPELDAYVASSSGKTSCLAKVDDQRIVLAAGESCELGLASGATLSASGSLLVAGVISGHNSTGLINYGTQAGDPAMFIAPPVEQFRRDYAFVTPPTFQKTFAAIIAPSGTQVTYQGTLISAAQRLESQTVTLDGQQWDLYNIAIDPGVHRLEADDPFGLIVYAYDDYVSYAFPGGLDLVPRTKEL